MGWRSALPLHQGPREKQACFWVWNNKNEGREYPRWVIVSVFGGNSDLNNQCLTGQILLASASQSENLSLVRRNLQSIYAKITGPCSAMMDADSNSAVCPIYIHIGITAFDYEGLGC